MGKSIDCSRARQTGITVSAHPRSSRAQFKSALSRMRNTCQTISPNAFLLICIYSMGLLSNCAKILLKDFSEDPFSRMARIAIFSAVLKDADKLEMDSLIKVCLYDLYLMTIKPSRCINN